MSISPAHRSVINTVCSKWADSEPSSVTTVQPSFKILTSGRPSVHHRLDGDGHSRDQCRRIPRAVIKIRHLRFLVHRPAHAMPDEFAHHAKAVSFHVLLDRERNVHHPVARPRRRDALMQGLLGHIQQLLGRHAASPHRHGPGGVANKSLIADPHVHADNVAKGQSPVRPAHAPPLHSPTDTYGTETEAHPHSRAVP